MSAEVTPPECLLVLNITEDCLSQEEKKIIEETILDNLGYQLGMVEKDEKRHTRTFILMMIGLIVSGALLWLTKALAEEVMARLGRQALIEKLKAADPRLATVFRMQQEGYDIPDIMAELNLSQRRVYDLVKKVKTIATEVL